MRSFQLLLGLHNTYRALTSSLAHLLTNQNPSFAALSIGLQVASLHHAPPWIIPPLRNLPIAIRNTGGRLMRDELYSCKENAGNVLNCLLLKLEKSLSLLLCDNLLHILAGDKYKYRGKPLDN